MSSVINPIQEIQKAQIANAKIDIISQFNPMYNFMFLNKLFKLDDNEKKNFLKTFINSEYNLNSTDNEKYIKDESWIKIESLNNYLNQNYGKEKINFNISNSDKNYKFDDIVYEIILQFNDSLIDLFNNNNNLIILLDYIDDNTSKDINNYLKKNDIKKELKDVIKAVNFQNSKNVFYLKILNRREIDETKYRTILENEFQRLNDYLQNETIEFLKDQTKNKKEKVIFFTDPNGNISIDYFVQSNINKNNLKLFNEYFNQFTTDTKLFVKKQYNNKINQNYIFKSKFIDIYKDLNLKNITNLLEGNSEYKKNPKFTNSKIALYHFIFFELYKETFIQDYKKNKIKKGIIDTLNYFNVYFKYNLQEENEYIINKIVINTNYKYILEIKNDRDGNDLSNYNIIGHFISKNALNYYMFVIDEINIINKNNKKDDEFKESLLNLLLKYSKDDSNKQRIKDLLNNHQKFVDFNRDLNLIKSNIKDEKINSLANNELYKNIKENFKEIDDLLFLIFNHKEILIKIKKEKNYKNPIFNFTILKKKEKKGYKKIIDGILKQNIKKSYYEEFTMNRINNNLPSIKNINYNKEILITEKSLSGYLKNKKGNDENMSKELLKLLNNDLDNYINFILENNNFNENQFILSMNMDDYEDDKKIDFFNKNVINKLIEIIFKEGTPFYVSNIKNIYKNSTNKKEYSTYLINNVEEKHFFYNQTDLNDVNLNKNDFKDNLNSNGNNLVKKNKYISFDDLEKKINNINNPIILINLNLAKKKDYIKGTNCKTKKNRIIQMIENLYNKKEIEFQKIIRSIKNNLKANRKMTQKIRNNNISSQKPIVSSG